MPALKVFNESVEIRVLKEPIFKPAKDKGKGLRKLLNKLFLKEKNDFKK